MPLKAMSKITLALPPHIDMDALWQHLENHSVVGTAMLFHSIHGLDRWRVNGHPGMKAWVGDVGRSRWTSMFLRRTFGDWRRMGEDIGVMVLPLQHPKYYQLLDNLYATERLGWTGYGRNSFCQMKSCGKRCYRRGMTTKAYGLVDLCRDHCCNLKNRDQLSEASIKRLEPGESGFLEDVAPAA